MHHQIVEWLVGDGENGVESSSAALRTCQFPFQAMDWLLWAGVSQIVRFEIKAVKDEERKREADVLTCNCGAGNGSAFLMPMSAEVC
jgi:hypothetical protein